MKQYEVTFRALIEAPDQKTMLQTAERVIDAVACDIILMDTGDYAKEIELEDYFLIDNDEEDE